MTDTSKVEMLAVTLENFAGEGDGYPPILEEAAATLRELVAANVLIKKRMDHSVTAEAKCRIELDDTRAQLAQVTRERDGMREALTRIATADYRGNRSQEAEMAFIALKESP